MLRRILRSALAAALWAAAFGASAAALDAPAQETMLDLGPYRLAGRCMGPAASPVLVLESPSGLATEAAFAKLLPHLSEHYRVCYLDRLGLGRSGPPPEGLLQTTRDYAADLKLFLQQQVPREKVLIVGYSFGGMVARYYASQNPEQVVGLLLLDPAHEEWLQEAKHNMRAEDWQKMEGIFAWFKKNLAHDYWRSQFDLVGTRLRANMPVRIVSRGLPFQRIRQAGLSEEGFQIYNASHDKKQAQMARLTDRTHRVVAMNSEHFVAQTEPELVLQELRALLQEIQSLPAH